MNGQEARALASTHRDSLVTFLQGVFGDVATAEKFARFVLQRLEVDFDEIEGDGISPRPLYALAREICREYVSSATFERLPLAQGDDGLPLAGVLPAGCADTLVLALPRTARLALRLIVVDGLAPADVEPVFQFSAPHLARFLERVSAALSPDGKLARLAGPLSDVATLVSPDPVAVAVRSTALPHEEPLAAQGPATSAVGTTQPGVRYAPPPAEATARSVEGMAAPARRTTRTAIPATSGSVPRGVSLSPLVTGGHPANRGAAAGASPFTKPFPTRTVAALPPPAAGRDKMLAAGLVAFLLVAGIPLSGFLGKAKANPRTAGAASASVAGAVLALAQPASVPRHPDPGAIGTVDLPGGQDAVMPGQEVTAPARGEAHVRLDAGVQIWLTSGSRAAVHADRVVLLAGVARVQVGGQATYLGIAEPLELKLSPGTYVLRRGDKLGSGLCTLTGLAESVGKVGRGMRAEAGRNVTVARDGSAETRDTGNRLDDGWGREASRVARAVADSAHFSALPSGAAELQAGALPAASTGANGRPLFQASGAGGHGTTVAAAGIAADRGAAGYRQAF